MSLLTCRGGSGVSSEARRQRIRSSHVRRKSPTYLERLALACLFLQNCHTATAQTNSTNGNNVPITICNNCHETMWPGIGTQNGVGPSTGGFELVAGNCSTVLVSWDWAGRVWPRTNCSFNANGTGPSNLNGVNGNGAACLTGDCMGALSCEYTGAPPATLFEVNLRGTGANAGQSFYDISLVDGYNVPLGVELNCTSPNVTDIPPNLTNLACIATAGYLDPPTRSGTYYSNSTYPIPWETTQDNANIGGWCPWDLQAYPPSRPGDGVYPYPDSDLQRPTFDPCLSACAATDSAQDCCTGSYNSPSACQPGLYSQQAKTVCPDVYSYAYDDQTSTFIVPAGCGYKIIFCPEGRSTNILQTFGAQLQALAASGHASKDVLADASNITFIETHGNGAGAVRPVPIVWLLLAALGALVALAR